MSVSRRTILKIGLVSGVMLGGLTLLARTGFSPRLAPSMQTLRVQDLPFLRRVIPVILKGALPKADPFNAVFKTLKGIDYALTYVSTPQLELAQQLLDVTASVATRGPLTGIWDDWETASDAEVEAFLIRWRDSPLALLQQGHSALLQMVQMGWYGQIDAWQHCGYPGPPPLV